MKVGIISDTHDRLDNLKKAIEIFYKEKVGLIIHCGDWISPFTLEYFDFICQGFRVPVKSVFGNNEGDIKRIIKRNANLKNPIQFPKEEAFKIEIGQKKSVVYHGHDLVILQSLIDSQVYDVVFTGHTHKARNKKIKKTLVLNPGTISFAANSRIIDSATVAVYSSESNSAEIITFK